MKPICVPCQRFYRCERNGIAFIEAMPVKNGALPGTAEPESWKPYKLWRGDQWKCEGCGHQLVAGVAREPVAEHYQDGFDRLVEHFAPTLMVNDC